MRRCPGPRPLRIATLMFVLVACSGTRAVEAPGRESAGREPPRVILVIADGTGISHWTAGVLSSDSMSLWRFPVTGLVDTRNVEGKITDSAASATAFATGVLTFNRFIGTGPDSAALETVMERASRQGMSTGLVATSSIVHATPAAFASHVTDRGEYEEIAAQMARSSVNVLLGGGRAYFDPTLREDGVDYLGELERQRQAVNSAADLVAAAAPETSGMVGLFADNAMPAADEGRSPTLAQMTGAALAVLDRDPDGFLLLVEASQIDWLAHDNQSFDRVASEVLDCDEALHLALDYVDRTPGALIVVVADHETGGTTVLEGATGWEMRYSSGGHTAELVPMFAAGDGASAFSGLHAIDDVGRLLSAAVLRDRGVSTD
jgi:alkaline phosphatase